MALDLSTDCAICGTKGGGEWCGDDREEPDSLGWICPCEASCSHKRMQAMMRKLFQAEELARGE